MPRYFLASANEKTYKYGTLSSPILSSNITKIITIHANTDSHQRLITINFNVPLLSAVTARQIQSYPTKS
jgi:hypothetical protein